MSKPIRVLLAENTATDAELNLRELKQAGIDAVFKMVETREDYEAALDEFKPEIILCDYKMPSFDAPEALAIIKERGLDVPFIIVSGSVGEELAIEAIKSGATDYVMKEKLGKLPVSFKRALREFSEKRELFSVRKTVEESLEASERSRLALLSVLEDVKNAERSLVKERAYLKQLVEMAPEGIVVHDLQGKLIQANREFLRMFGYTEKEILGKPIDELIVPHDKQDEALAYTSSVVSGKTFNVETIRQGKEGNKFDVSIIGAPIIVEGQQTAVYAIYRDISERKLAEKALIENEKLLRVMADNYPNSYISIINKDLSIGYTAGQEFQKAGLDPKLFVGMTLEQVFGDKADIVKEHYLETFAGKENSFELFINNQHQLYKMVPLFDENKRINRILTVVENITERKKAEDELRDLNKLLSSFISNSPIYAYVKEVLPESSKVIMASENFSDMIGIPGSQMVGKTMDELFSPEFAEKITIDDRLVVDRGVLLTMEENLKGRNYTTLKFPIKVGEKNLLAGYTIDITERKKAEEELLESRGRLRTLIDTLPEYIWLKNGKGVYLSCNPKFEEFIGTKETGVIGKTDYDFFNRELADFFREKDREAINAGKPSVNEEEVTRAVDQKKIILETTKTPMFDADGNLIGVLGIGHDITERKKAEQAIAEREQDYRTLTHNMPGLVYRVHLDENNRMQFFNDMLEKVTGYREEELTHGDVCSIDPLIFDEDSPKVIKIVKDAVLHKNPFQVEYRLRHKNGQTRYMSEKGQPVTGADGKPKYIDGLIIDITEAKVAEQKLTESNRKINILLNNLRGVAYRCQNNPNWTMEYISNGIQEMTGYGAEDFINDSVRTYSSIIDIEDRQRIWDEIQESIKVNKPYTLEYKILTKDGQIKWVWERGRGFNEGNSVFLEGFIADITERKYFEHELSEREARLRMIFDILPLGLWFADKDGKLVTGNPAGVRIWGAEPHVPIEEYGIFKARRLPNGNEIAPNDWALAHTIKEGVIITDELLEIDAFDGEKKIILNYTAPILDDNGRVQGAIVVNNDITERYRAEELVKASLKEKEVMLKEIHHRVKNNLQIIASLLNLQTGYVKDERYKKMFLESQSRVRSMALVHEKLYKSKDLSGIDFSDYINGLMSDLYSSYGMTQNDVALDTDILKDKIPIDLAIPCGLIINELATNSFKYAFKEKKAKGLISIALKRDDSGLYTLEVNDNGPGIKNDLDLKNTPTLGLQLVDALVGQLDAEIKITNDGGTKVTIKFKV